MIRKENIKIPKQLNFVPLFETLANGRDLKEYLLREKRDKIIDQGYKIIKSDIFSKKYINLMRFLRQEIGFDFYYQKLPSLRVSKPGDNENPFHIDTWSGHGDKIINFWTPLVDVNEYNSLRIVDKSKTLELINKHIHHQKFNRNLFQKESLKYSKPLKARVSELSIFSNQTLHGTVKNISKETRLSFDFRILKVGDDPGTRDINLFYSLMSIKKMKTSKKIKAAHAMLYSTNDVKHVSHSSQRKIIEDYCSRKSINLFEESSEMHGVEHYPNLISQIKSKKYIIVLFSVKCLPIKGKIRKSILKLLRSYKKGVHFALENKTVHDLSDSQISRYLRIF